MIQEKNTENRILKLILFSSVITILAIFCAVLLWYQKIFPHKFMLGERAPYSIIVEKESLVIDKKETEKRKNKAKEKLLEYFLKKPPLQRDDSFNKESLKILNKKIKNLDEFFQEKNNMTNEEIKDFFLGNDEYKRYLEFNRKNWLNIKKYIPETANLILKHGYIGNIEEKTLKNIIKEKIHEKDISLLRTVIQDSLIPNISIDISKFDEFEKQELSKVSPVFIIIPAKGIIIKKGEIITLEKYSLLKQLNIYGKNNFNIYEFREALIFTFLATLFFLFYIRLEKFKFTFRRIVLFSTILLTASAFIGFFVYDKPAFLPFAAVNLLISIFFNLSIGLIVGLLFCFISILAIDINPFFLIPSIAAMLMTNIISRKANNRADLVKGGIVLATVQMSAFILISIISRNLSFSFLELSYHALAGFFTAFIISNIMPFLEIIFAVVNRFRLKELSDLEQPLLKKLKEIAPGTFEHTLTVADFANDAAQKIGADSELTRVGVLYHDIGKIANPKIFIENQFNSYNPHDDMTPLESAKKLIRHVEKGIELAKKEGIPEPVYCFIASHQGTSKVGHFFNKAKEIDPTLVDDSDYRYLGPKPLSKEEGIVMLADAVEATIRSLKLSDEREVKATINKIINNKIEDYQLINSTLTKIEINKIAESFFENWKNKNHKRIKYEEG